MKSTDVKELQRLLLAAEKRAQEAEAQLRATTLTEYITACHNLIFTKLEVETDRALTTTGRQTNPNNKLCPPRLEPWVDFIDKQKTAFGALHLAFPKDNQAFESVEFLRALGNRLAKKKVANEKDLELFQHLAVEDPVRAMVDRLAQEDSVRLEFDLGDGVKFENHPHALDDDSAEVRNRLAESRPLMTPAQARLNLDQLRPDQICVYRQNHGASDERLDTIAYIVEYKAPHKLTLPQLRAGLRQMDIYKDVVNRAEIPVEQDLEGLFAYHADRLVAAAVTQTFHYMVHAGLDYSYLTTGEGIVFLYLGWDTSPVTLYYHLTEPASEVQAHAQNAPYCSAVGQVLAFTLMALTQSLEHSQQEREHVTKDLKVWAVDWQQVLLGIPTTARKAPPDSTSYCPTTYSEVDRTPYNLRWGRKLPKKRKRTAEVDVFGTGNNRTPEPSDDDGNEPGGPLPLPNTPSPTEPRSRGRGGGQHAPPGPARQSPGEGSDRGRGRGRHRSAAVPAGDYYCTQNCLLGLVGSGLLDERCPNATLHRPSPHYTRHPIDHVTFLRLLRDQFQKTLDDGLVQLNKGGARGVLFRVTLLKYGYTFVSKGTVEAFVPDLEHEAAVYHRLRPLQGVCVPVFLGAIDLRDLGRTYYYGLKVRIIYMMLLSWGGTAIDMNADDGPLVAALQQAAGTVGTAETPDKALNQSVRALHSMGVVHKDIRRENLLWSAETGRLMMIDFERSGLLDPPPRQAFRDPLIITAPNPKRTRTHGPPRVDEANGGGKAVMHQTQLTAVSPLSNALIAEDIVRARGIFMDYWA
ncbi:hypothetical protein B0T25DRAFT_561127 [Lasiosphaeria hispida]|uniref:Protein kinase domain-containing protein n=1 Tax=Lasiosphaeria hispida TaxID=260671 RepID=A0AAJ0H4T2_9PEZI|nr:hypothetical protein B0T25DRAFT_561127 [Lasiosphaeria hispida]